MIDVVSMNATQIAGCVAFAVSAAASGVVAARRRGGGPVWWPLASANALLSIEVVAGWRFQVHELANASLRGHGWYADRGRLQFGLIALAFVVIVAGAAALAGANRRERNAVGALIGTAAALAVFVVETLSLHRVDTFMYAQAGPVLTIAWMWMAAAAVVTANAWRAARRR